MSKSVISFRVERRLRPCLTCDGVRAQQSLACQHAPAPEVEREAEFLAFVDEGIADLDAGRTVTHEELVAEIRSRRLGSKAA